MPTTPVFYVDGFKTTLKKGLTSAGQTAGIVLNPVIDSRTGAPRIFSSFPMLLRFSRQDQGEEWVYVPSFTQDADGNFTLTGSVLRDVNPDDGSSYVVGANPVKWLSQTDVELVVSAKQLQLAAYRDVANQFLALQTFTLGLDVTGKYVKVPVYADATARDAAIPSPSNGMSVYQTDVGAFMDYKGGAWVQRGDTGTSNGSTTVAGKFEEATIAEQGTSSPTGATGARLVPAVANLVKSSSGAADENKIAVLDAAGKFAVGFMPTGLAIIPTGGGLLWYTGTAPTGFLLCDGSAVSRTTYAALFGVIGTTYGVGDGSTTFNLPDFKGRGPLGPGTGTKVWAATSIDTPDDQITVPSNTSLQTGQAVVYSSNGGTDATGLTSAATYYVIRIDATHIKLAASQADAGAGVAITISSAGAGTQTLTQTLTARTLGDIGGVEFVNVDHRHAVDPDNTSINRSGGGGNSFGWDVNTGGFSGYASANSTPTTMNPFLVVNFIIKT